MNVLALAFDHKRWLGARQAVVAENVANASTPGYKGRDVSPFESHVSLSRHPQAATHERHFAAREGGAPALTGYGLVNEAGDGSWSTSHSGNDVTLEQEMLKATEIAKMFALDASLVKSFHRMLLSSVKG